MGKDTEFFKAAIAVMIFLFIAIVILSLERTGIISKNAAVYSEMAAAILTFAIGSILILRPSRRSDDPPKRKE